jgi:hypothetical protein
MDSLSLTGKADDGQPPRQVLDLRLPAPQVVRRGDRGQ